ncbi:hypothetical protein RHGRI_006571 [Rhododendron griersonianum]|uniref:Cytochrome P450 n=1 Tax=Rhododendron griersonianum TaxID=479676 RepID=A0AAV6KU78_9ERIC|nr:hypothetical protein RHGRI_006571 [Rhododendron griersonianum]
MANREVSDGSELTMTHIKALLLNWYIACIDKSAGTVEWALAEMIRNHRILERAQKEMDRVIGRDRLLEESDLPNLPYLQTICKETLRLHPPVPLSIPRVSVDPCEVNTYYIPKNTRLFVYVWAIG